MATTTQTDDDAVCSVCGTPHPPEAIEARRAAWRETGEKPPPYNPCGSCAAGMMNKSLGIAMGVIAQTAVVRPQDPPIFKALDPTDESERSYCPDCKETHAENDCVEDVAELIRLLCDAQYDVRDTLRRGAEEWERNAAEKRATSLEEKLRYQCKARFT